MVTIILVVLFCLLFPPMATILYLLLIHKTKARPIVEPSDLNRLDSSAQLRFQTVSADLAREGFRECGDYRVQFITNTWSYSRLFSDDKGIIAHHTLIRSGGHQRFVLEFCTEFVNGLEINTNNMDAPSIFNFNDNKFIFQFSHCVPYDLLRLHRQMIMQKGGESLINSAVDPLQNLRESVARDCDYQVRKGLLRHDQFGECYRYTLTGAVRSTIRLWLFMLFQINPQKKINKAGGIQYKTSKGYKMTTSTEKGKKSEQILSNIGCVLVGLGIFTFLRRPAQTRLSLLFRGGVMLLGALLIIIAIVIGRQNKNRSEQLR